MSNPYTTKTIANYNTSPPADDASAVASNQLFWSKHKEKLGDPIKTLAEAVNAEALAAFGKLHLYAGRTVSTTDSLIAADERKVVNCTGTFAFTLLTSATAADGFTVAIRNSGTGAVTIDGAGTETINGQLTYLLNNQYDAVLLRADGVGWEIVSEYIGAGADGTALTSDGTSKSWTPAGLPTSYLTGLVLSNNATDAVNDIDIAVGKCRDTADATDLIVSSAIGKRLDAAWVVGGTPGTPTGGLSSSLSLTNDTWYHAILGKVSGTITVIFDTSVTGANAVTDHSLTDPRRIGSVLRGTATNETFYQRGDHFLWDAVVSDDDNATPGTTARTITLTVPTGIVVDAEIIGTVVQSGVGGNAVLFTPLVVSDQTPTVSNLGHALSPVNPNSGSWVDVAKMSVRTNTSAQIRSRTALSSQTRIYTEGWIDRRGRDG